MIDIIYKCNSKILYYMFFLTNGENEIKYYKSWQTFLYKNKALRLVHGHILNKTCKVGSARDV